MRLPLPGGAQSPAMIFLLAILATYVQAAFPTVLTGHFNPTNDISRITSADEAFQVLITRYFPIVDNLSASMLDARDVIMQNMKDIEPSLHCNGESHSAIQACLESLQTQLINSLKVDNLTEAREALGKILYTAQLNANLHVAASALDSIIQCLDEIKPKMSNFHFRQLFGVGSTLAVFVDTAGSMKEIMPSASALIISTVLDRLETAREPSTYLIVTFDDAGAAPIITTSNHVTFRSALYDLETSSGTECTHLAMRGLLDGIEALDEGSDLLVLTDAEPKDIDLVVKVVAAALRKHISVEIFKFESRCDHETATEQKNSLSKNVYMSIALGTSGKIHSLPRPNAVTVSGFVNEPAAVDDDLRLEITDDLGSVFESRTYSIPVASQVAELVISLTGPDLGMRVSLPMGPILLSNSANADHIVSLEGELWTISEPIAGPWTVRLSGTGPFSLGVTATSHVSFSDAKAPAHKVQPKRRDNALAFPRNRRPAPFGNMTTTHTVASSTSSTDSIIGATASQTSSGTATGTASFPASTTKFPETVSTNSLPATSTNATGTSTAPSQSGATSVDPSASTTYLSVSFANGSTTAGTTSLPASLIDATVVKTVPGNSTSFISSSGSGTSAFSNGTNSLGATSVSTESTNSTSIPTAVPGNSTGLTSLPSAITAPFVNGSTTGDVGSSITASINSTSAITPSAGNSTSLGSAATPAIISSTMLRNGSTTTTVTLSLITPANSTIATVPLSGNSTSLAEAVSSTTIGAPPFVNGSSTATPTPSPTRSINSTDVAISFPGNSTRLAEVVSSTTSGTPLFVNGSSSATLTPSPTTFVNSTSIATSFGNFTDSTEAFSSTTNSVPPFGNRSTVAVTPSLTVSANSTSTATPSSGNATDSTDKFPSITVSVPPFGNSSTVVVTPSFTASVNSTSGTTSSGNSTGSTDTSPFATSSAPPFGNSSTTVAVTPSFTASVNSTSGTTSSRDLTGSTDTSPFATSSVPPFGNSSTTVAVTPSLTVSVNSTGTAAPSSANSTDSTDTFPFATSSVPLFGNSSTTVAVTPLLTVSVNSTSGAKSSYGNATSLNDAVSSTSSATPLYKNETNTAIIVPATTNSNKAVSATAVAGNTTGSTSSAESLTELTRSFGNETRTARASSNSTDPITSLSITGSASGNETGIVGGLSTSRSFVTFSTAATAPFQNVTSTASPSLFTATESLRSMATSMSSLLPTLLSNGTPNSDPGGLSTSSNTARPPLANVTIPTRTPLMTESDAISINTSTEISRTATNGAPSNSSQMYSSGGLTTPDSPVAIETTKHTILGTDTPIGSTRNHMYTTTPLADPTSRLISTISSSLDSVPTLISITSYPSTTTCLLDIPGGSELTVTEILYTTTSYCLITICPTVSGLSPCLVTNSISTITLTSTVVVPCNKCSAPSHLVTLPPVSMLSASSYNAASHNDVTIIEIIYITTSLCPVTLTGVISDSTTEKVTDYTSKLTLTLTSTKHCEICGPARATVTLSLLPESPGSGAANLPSSILGINPIVSVLQPAQTGTLIRPTSPGYECEGSGCGTDENLRTLPATIGCGGSGCQSPGTRNTLPATSITLGATMWTGDRYGKPVQVPTVADTSESGANRFGSNTLGLITPAGSKLPIASNDSTATRLSPGGASAGVSNGHTAASIKSSGDTGFSGPAISRPVSTIGAGGLPEASITPPATAITLVETETRSLKASNGLNTAVTIVPDEIGSPGSAHGSPATATAILSEAGPPGSLHNLPATATLILSETGPPGSSHAPPTTAAVILTQVGSTGSSYSLPAIATGAVILSEIESPGSSHGSPAVGTVILSGPGSPGSPGSSNSQPATSAATAILSEVAPPGSSHAPPTAAMAILTQVGSAGSSYSPPAIATGIAILSEVGPPVSSQGSPTAAAIILSGPGSPETFYGRPAAATSTPGVNAPAKASQTQNTFATITLGGSGSLEASYAPVTALFTAPGGAESTGAHSAPVFTLIMPPLESGSSGVINGPSAATQIKSGGSGLPDEANGPHAPTPTLSGGSRSAGASNLSPPSMLTISTGSGSAGAANSPSVFTLSTPVGSSTSTLSTSTAVRVISATGYHGPYFTGGAGKIPNFMGQSIAVGIVVIIIAGIAVL